MSTYTHFTRKERVRLFTFLQMNISITEIARRMKRHRSSIYRERSRNMHGRYYLPRIANDLYLKRRNTKPKKLHNNRALYGYVVRRLRQGWSPEIISGRLKYENKSYYACAETIYRYVKQQFKVNTFSV